MRGLDIFKQARKNAVSEAIDSEDNSSLVEKLQKKKLGESYKTQFTEGEHTKGNYDLTNQDYMTGYENPETQDLNELRASRQSGTTQLGLGLLRASSKAAQEVTKLPGVIGGIAMAPFAKEGEGYDTAFNNSWIKTIDEIGEKINTDLLPVYTAKAVKEGNLWDNISSTSFWATDGADGLGFIIGMMAPGAIFEYAGLGGKLIGAAANNAKLAKFTSMAGKAEEGVNALKFMGATGKNIDSGLAVMGNTLFEAGAEAKSVGDDLDRKKPEFMTRRVAEIKKNLTESNYTSEPEFIQGPMQMIKNPDGTQSMSSPGLVPNPNYKNLDQIALEQAENEFKEQRALAMRNTFVSNVGILLGPNAMMHKAIWGKAAQKFEKSAEAGIKGIAKRVGKSAERVGKAFAVEGGWEEGSQTTVENMFVNKAMQGSLGKNNFTDDFNTGDFTKEYANTLSSTEGQKAIFLGGALGGPMMSYQGRKEDVANRKRTNEVLDGIDKQITHFNNIFDNDIYQKNEDGSVKYKTDENGNETTERLVDNKAVRKLAQDLNYTEQQSAMFDLAVKTGNTEVVDKLKQDAIFNLILPSIHNGEMGLQALEQQLNENSKFQELVERDAKADNKDKTKEFVKQTLETAKYLQKQNEKFGDFSRDVIDLTHPTATQQQKDDFLNKLNTSYLNSKHELRQNEIKLKALEAKRENIYDELGLDPLYDAEAEFPTAKMKNGVVSDENLMQRAERTKEALNSNELLKKTEAEYNELRQKIDNHKKDISEIWQGKDKIAGAFNDFVDKDNKDTEDTSDEKVAQADQLITNVANAQSNAELDQLLLPAYTPQKTEADYNRETELNLIQNISKSINEDQSIGNLKLNLDKLKSLNISSLKIDEIAKRIEDRIKQLQDEQESFKDYLLDAINSFDEQSQKVNDFISDLNTEIDSLLKTKDVLIKSLNEQDKSPRGRNAKLIKQLIKEAENELAKVEKELEYLEGLKEEAQKELTKIEKDLSYIFNRYDQIEKSDFASVQDIIDYLNDNKELFKDHRFDFERLLVNKHYTEQNIEGLSTVIEKLDTYKNVLESMLKVLKEPFKDTNISNEEFDRYIYLSRELDNTTEELKGVKKDLKDAQEKLKRLNRAILDKQAIKSVNLEEDFWKDLQTFKKDKINPLVNNPIIAEKIQAKRDELTQQEQEVADQIAEEQVDLQEDQIINNPTQVTEVVAPTVTLDENDNFQSESLPTQVDEDEDNEVVHAENMSEEKINESLKGEVAGAKIISTNRETGETLYDNLQDFVDYERTPRDKSNDEVTFEVDVKDIKDKDVKSAYDKLLNGKKLSDKEIKLLEEKLPIKVTITDDKGNGHVSYIEAHSKANQSDPDSKQMLEQQTMPLRRNIIAEAIKNKSLKGITSSITKQYPGLLTVEYTDEGVAKNDIFGLQVFDGMSEDEKVVYFQKNSAFVNWEGNLVSTLNPKKVIQSNFGQNHKGEVFLNIPQNNGKPFYLKLNVSKVSEDKAEAIYEMVNALSQVSQTISAPTNFQAMTVGKFFETLDGIDPALSSRLQDVLKNEIEFVKQYNRGDERNESLSRFLDLLIYHKSENKKTAFNLSKDGSLTLGELAMHLMDGQGFRHKLTITKAELAMTNEDLNNPGMKDIVKGIITKYIQAKRHNVLITKDNVGEFVFNNKDYVKYLLNSEYPILTTNAVVNQPTFQGYSNVYLNQDVKNSNTTNILSGRGTIAPMAPPEVVAQQDIAAKKADIKRREQEEINKQSSKKSMIDFKAFSIGIAKLSEKGGGAFGYTFSINTTIPIFSDKLKKVVKIQRNEYAGLEHKTDSFTKEYSLETEDDIIINDVLENFKNDNAFRKFTDDPKLIETYSYPKKIEEINAKYNAELAALEGNNQQVSATPIEIESANEDGTLPSVKARLAAALGNKTQPTKKEDVKMDVISIQSLYDNANEDVRLDILFNIADKLGGVDNIKEETITSLLAKAHEKNISIDMTEINKICGL